MRLFKNRNLYQVLLLGIVLDTFCFAGMDATFSETNIINYYSNSDYGKYIFFDYNRLRSDIDLKELLPFLSFKAVLDLETYAGGPFLASGDFAAINSAGLNLPFNPYLNILNENSVNARLYLYRLYSELKLGKSDLILGFQRIPFGVGRLWNPTDTFNPVNILSSEPEERTGVPAANLSWYLSDFSYLQGISSFGVNMRIEKYGLRYKADILGIDTGFSCIKDETFLMLGAEFETNLFETGIEIRNETGYFDNNYLDKRYVSSVLGAEYAFPGNITVLAEYFYNGLGNNKSGYNQNILINGNWNLGMQYFGANVRCEINPLTTVSLTSIINLQDGSLCNIPDVIYSLNDEAALSIGANIFYGDMASEFGYYYKNNYYMKIETYF